jgi:recombination protein RecR|tara:strand:- start:644 stop:1252 length:609 start_codon:yes stop_codon:yes gene_type:complete
MNNNIPEIEDLIKKFSKLPGLGPKSAKRIILKLINNKENMIKPLAKVLAAVYKNVSRCIDCGNLKVVNQKCICETDNNSYDKICVVENLSDMWVIESANIYKGYFHILGGTLNSDEKYEKKNLLIDSLVKRVKKNNLKEVIIATSATVEGQTTAHYIEDVIKNNKIKVSKLGQGLPVGGEIEQLDDGTLVSAFKNRVPVSSD